MDIPITLTLTLVFGLVCFMVGLSKAGFGGALGFLLTPILALVIPLNKAVGIMLPVLMLGDVFALAAYWRKWEARQMWILLAGGVAGVIAATFVLVNVPVDWLKKGLALLVIVFLCYRLLERRILASLNYRSQPWHGLLAGSTAGFTSALAHAGGPPIAIYLLLQRLPPAIYIGTTVLFFAVLNWLKVPFYYAGGLFDFPLQLRLIWMLPMVPLGVWVGKSLVDRINRRIFEQVILVLLAISAVLLLLE